MYQCGIGDKVFIIQQGYDSEGNVKDYLFPGILKKFTSRSRAKIQVTKPYVCKCDVSCSVLITAKYGCEVFELRNIIPRKCVKVGKNYFKVIEPFEWKI